MLPSLWGGLQRRGRMGSYDGQIRVQIVRYFLFPANRLHANGHDPREDNCSGLFELKQLHDTAIYLPHLVPASVHARP